ncbi:hypothetical protein HQ29_01565 [Porphyromonas canoris]|uniref:hypothetical protein n=1 Tax=Porphyromonas TaxID=836 RepID=UPI00051D5985|nr:MULTISPECIES: hypothetical protein [Porphyromonas]KGL53293.1 hypothetical protein HQ29_01565 [Porphyromonas canoris]KGN96301.1 hypothetical protein HQ39_02960 [Porphyromonas sp. COT-108 OH2963]
MKIFSLSGHLYSGKRTQSEFSDDAVVLLPDSAYVKSGKPVFPPIEEGEPVAVMPVLVLKMNRIGKSIAPRFIHRYYSAITVGYSLLLPELLDTLSSQGVPTFSAYGFDGALVWGETGFSPELIRENGAVKVFHQKGEAQEEIHIPVELLTKAEETLARLSRYHTIKIGDIFLLPLRQAFDTAAIGDNLCLLLEDTNQKEEAQLLTRLSLR